MRFAAFTLLTLAPRALQLPVHWPARLAAACLLLIGLAQPAGAQALPHHFDPAAREDAPNRASVPALRFLTTTGYPPFNYREPGGALVGYHIDLARAICDTLEVVCTIQAWPWEQVSDALEDNQGDALIGGLALTAETADRFDFSSVYLRLPARFVARIEDVPGFDVGAIGAKRIAVREGSRHADFLAEYLPGAEQVPFDTEFSALEALGDGDADAFFGDGLRAAFWLNDNPQCCGYAGAAFFRPDYFGPGLAIAVPAGHDDVRDAINAALVRLHKARKLDELYLRWFPIGFY